MTPEQCLPNALLIILHLHLLNYPLQDAAGYNERLFDQSRGMRERTKAMEDITYFLVTRVEGSKERAKALLPTYPCLQPSDTAPYRMGLAKYLESLRSAVAHTTHASDSKGKSPAPAAIDEASAWWWKDVVVRKSILDECSGDRFERLILALSTHAVLKSTSLRASSLSAKDDHEADLGELSRDYTTRLAAAQTAKQEWERSAALLLARQSDLARIRARIADPKQAGSSRFESLATDRLLALRDSRYQDLLRTSWAGVEGRSALHLVTELAGLLDASASVTSEPMDKATGTGAENPSQSQTGLGIPQPLPIAAAHHPAQIHALRLPLFPRSSPSKPSSTASQDLSQAHAIDSCSPPHAVVERLAAIEKIQTALQMALTSTQSVHGQIQHRLQNAKAMAKEEASHQSSHMANIRLDAGLWHRRAGTPVDFQKSPDASSTFALAGLARSNAEHTVEERIAHIRATVLPPFTADPLPLPLPASDAEWAIAPERSRIPQPAPRAHRTAGAPAHPASRNLNTLRPVAAPPKQRQVRVAQAQAGTAAHSRIPSGSVPVKRGVLAARADADARARRMSRRASAARTRRSTMFGRGEDADIFRIAQSVQDRSDPEDEDEGEESPDATRPVPRTPARAHAQITRGTLLSNVKKSVPRQSFDIEKYERVQLPRLPSLHLHTAPELEEDEDEDANELIQEIQAVRYATSDMGGEAGVDEIYEGNSMTLADILLQAGHQGDASMQLLEEDELGDDMSDWE
ncbi:hypothetical protein C8Q80DRAFT_1274349 [Daedaleopsis nitida]|nr:hypothetical protein C8Q80DRAFT_1274349 [Daedaleopsis nitida]